MKQDSVIFNHKKVVNICIVHEISKSININNYPSLGNCFFGAVRLTKNAYIDKNKYSWYGIGFDRKGFFSIGNEVGRNVIIFGVDIVHPHTLIIRKKIFWFSVKVQHKD